MKDVTMFKPSMKSKKLITGAIVLFLLLTFGQISYGAEVIIASHSNCASSARDGQKA